MMGCLTCKRCMVAIVIILILIVIISLILSLRPSDECYAKAAVAADAGTCSEIGRDILKRKGSAVDAAIATLLCLSLFNAHSTGIGGGGVFTIYNASTGKVETIDAREMAPMSASENMFGNNPQNAKPGLFIAVPGELRGYELAHKRHGRLQWKELFEPSIKLAREGFKLGRALAKAIYWNKDVIMNDTTLCEVFCDSNNNLLKENDSIRFPQLALTYEKIAEEGPDAFYDGSLTQDIVDAIQAAGGIVTREDLKGFKPVLNEYAFNFTVGNYIYHAPDAPFGGPILALILNILKGYNISSSSVSTTENKILTHHRMIETFRFASAHKTGLGDPRYENITSFVQNITSDSFADHIRSKIKDDTTVQESNYYSDNTASDEYGTTHLSIIAEDGSAVAVTSSINEHFGSKVMSHSTGIIFNDQMQDFDYTGLRISKNLIKPGKKPRSSMCPTIILDKHSKQVRMVVGASGGPNITSSTAQVILNHLFFDYDLQKAVNEPRVHSQLKPSKTLAEENLDESITDGLKLKNHIIIKAPSLGKVQAIVQQGDKICAESDHRKGGYPAGY